MSLLEELLRYVAARCLYAGASYAWGLSQRIQPPDADEEQLAQHLAEIVAPQRMRGDCQGQLGKAREQG